MSTVLAWLAVIAFALTAGSIIVNVAARNWQRGLGNGKCAYCRARLAGVGTGFATTCRRCGRDQP